MGTSQRTFDQVKNILGKLDRDIDAARAKRTQPPAPAVPVQPALSNPAASTPISAPPGTPGASTSPFGIGQPSRSAPISHATTGGGNGPSFTAQGRPKAMKLDRSATASPN